eukprot:3941976-Rhodomonas_salina.10
MNYTQASQWCADYGKELGIEGGGYLASIPREDLQPSIVELLKTSFEPEVYDANFLVLVGDECYPSPINSSRIECKYQNPCSVRGSRGTQAGRFIFMTEEEASDLIPRTWKSNPNPLPSTLTELTGADTNAAGGCFYDMQASSAWWFRRMKLITRVQRPGSGSMECHAHFRTGFRAARSLTTSTPWADSTHHW